MRIAQLAPLSESVPPPYYGGTERIVHYLTEELVREGHEVTLFASGDSRTSATLKSVYPYSLRTDPSVELPDAYRFQSMEQAFSAASTFDVLHSHLDFFAFPHARCCVKPVVTTLHGRLDLSELPGLYDAYGELPFVSISHAQRRSMPNINWVGNIHHGLPRDLYKPAPGKGGYLAFLGRVSKEKYVDHAIEVAKQTGIPLKIAAKVDPADQVFFDQKIKPLLDHPLVEFMGEITDEEKQSFLGNARALVAPFDWPEPFGLVFIEALACGTPVCAYRRGSVPEIIKHGKTGFICDTLGDLIDAVSHTADIDRAACRASFDAYFTAERMARDYMAVYEGLIQANSYPRAAHTLPAT